MGKKLFADKATRKFQIPILLGLIWTTPMIWGGVVAIMSYDNPSSVAVWQTHIAEVILLVSLILCIVLFSLLLVAVGQERVDRIGKR